MLNLSSIVSDYPFVEFNSSEQTGPFYVLDMTGEMWVRNNYQSHTLTRLGAEFGFFLENIKVFHTLNGGMRKINTRDDPIANNDHIFYFANYADLEAFENFVNYLTQNPLPKKLFPDISSIVGSMDRGDPKTLHTIRYPVVEEINTKTLEIWRWFRNRCQGDIWRYGEYLLVFEREDDLVAFKLQFCGQVDG